VIPVTSLLVPLLARQHHWTAAVAGAIVGAQSAGAIAVALWVARRGSAARPGITAAIGLAVIAAGEVIVGLTPARPLAVLGAALMGAGSGVFVCNLSPVLLGAAPRSHLMCRWRLVRLRRDVTDAQSAREAGRQNVAGLTAGGAGRVPCRAEEIDVEGPDGEQAFLGDAEIADGRLPGERSRPAEISRSELSAAGRHHPHL
jgi:hypothetical protein